MQHRTERLKTAPRNFEWLQSAVSPLSRFGVTDWVRNNCAKARGPFHQAHPSITARINQNGASLLINAQSPRADRLADWLPAPSVYNVKHMAIEQRVVFVCSWSFYTDSQAACIPGAKRVNEWVVGRAGVGESFEAFHAHRRPEWATPRWHGKHTHRVSEWVRDRYGSTSKDLRVAKSQCGVCAHCSDGFISECAQGN